MNDLTISPEKSLHLKTGKNVLLFLFERSEFLIATSPQKNLCVCSTNLGFNGEKKLCLCSTNLGFSEVRIMYQIRMHLVSAGINLYVRYVPDTCVPGISRQKSIRTYVMFRPWTHVWRQLHLLAVARCSDSYRIFYLGLRQRISDIHIASGSRYASAPLPTT